FLVPTSHPGLILDSISVKANNQFFCIRVIEEFSGVSLFKHMPSGSITSEGTNKVPEISNSSPEHRYPNFNKRREQLSGNNDDESEKCDSRHVSNEPKEVTEPPEQ
ncbi:hypothetical protein Ancab_025405, partial [Ancistrocladus abbreviatus]